MRTLLAYREDGPIARAIGRLSHPLAPSLLMLLAVAPLAAAVAARADGTGTAAVVLAWLVVLGGLSRGGDLDRDRFRWTVPPLLRAGEYAALVWLSPKGALALIVVLAFHHYDLVYRPRYQARTPPLVGGGWDTRLVGAWIALAAGALPEAFYVAAGILGALFVAECVASWRRPSAGDAPALYDDTEGEAE
jgi:hypothetical protein